MIENPFADWPAENVCDTCDADIHLCNTKRRASYYGNGCPVYTPNKYQRWRACWEFKIQLWRAISKAFVEAFGKVDDPVVIDKATLDELKEQAGKWNGFLKGSMNRLIGNYFGNELFEKLNEQEEKLRLLKHVEVKNESINSSM